MQKIMTRSAWMLLLFSVVLFSQPVTFESGYRNLKISPDGNKIIYALDSCAGFYLTKLSNNKTTKISTQKGSAYQASWSADGDLILFKQFVWKNKHLYQVPAIYDLENKKIILLTKPAIRCGTPSISNEGTVAFTIGKILFLSTINGVIKKSIKLPGYSNLTPISPDGKYVILNDKNDQLWKLNVATEEKFLLADSERGFFEPVWSPDSKHIVASRMDGTLTIFDIQNNSFYSVGKGTQPTWTSDGKWVIFSRSEILLNREVLNMDLYAIKSNGAELLQITKTDDWEDFPTISKNILLYSIRNSEEIKSVQFTASAKAIKLSNPTTIQIETIPEKSMPLDLKSEIKKSQKLNDVYFDIPYVHQRYDTPDWFNGNWACGATSAIQCIAYFGLVQQWPVWVSSPFMHISDYGNYICEIYTYNGFTFNIGGRDPNGTLGYGGYGYIIRNNWYNTKGYMRDYAIIHGLSSAVDWNPNRSKVANEIANDHPFVLLNSLTSSGHYISVIGYVDIDTTTVIVNDPYGNKNQGYANFYGRRAHYDWPGYNNGYENLNTVWCFIYFRGDPPADLCALNVICNTDTGQVSQQVQVSTDISNIGKMPSIPGTVEFFVSENGIYDENAFVIASYNLPVLDTAQVFSINDSVSLPDSLISETYKLSVFVDSDTLNKEMLKDNNVAFRNLSIHGYPRIYSTLPEDSSIVAEPRPEIRAKFQDVLTRIDTSNVFLFLDNVDVTNLCTKATRKITYTPAEDLAEGLHNVTVKIPSNYGLTTIKNWNFNIQLPTSLPDPANEIPEDFYLAQNYPNPFNPITKIEFNLKSPGKVNLSVFDLSGKTVAELITNRNYRAGKQHVTFDGSFLASGVYFYKIVINTNDRNAIFTNFRKMILIK